MTYKLRQSALFCLAFVSAACLITGCASSGAAYQPVVDGPKGPAYQADLQDCQQLAETRQYDNADVRTSATVGAGIGGLIGAVDGGVGEAAAGAVIGGLFGGGGEALETREERKEIVKNCMVGRGHNVVG
ncbi:MAG: glycine zipper family protein [Pseudomonadota bacterium]